MSENWADIVEAERESNKRIGGLIESAPGSKENYEGVDLRRQIPSPAAVQLIKEELARRHSVVPLEVKNGVLTVAAAEPSPALANLLGMVARCRVKFKVATPEEIKRAQDLSYGRVVALPQTPVETEEAAQWSEEVLGRLLSSAIKAKASDVHLEPQEDKVIARYRIDGVLHDASDISLADYPAVVGRIKVLAGLSVVDSHIPQDGQMTYNSVDIRVSTLPTVHGIEKIVMRILDRRKVVFRLEELGFEEEALQTYREIIALPYGMILVVGPTGSGKTTTLYATLNELDRTSRNVISLEDPVEYRFNRVTQVQVNPKAGLTFAAGLRSILRQDPDVIVVGEIRDAETASIAVQAALTGHLVLSSLHATDTISAVFRLLDIGIEPYLVAAALSGVVAQRLVRMTCRECGKTVSISPAEKSYIEKYLPGHDIETQFAGDGCMACGGTGYTGRESVTEVLALTQDLKHMIGQGSSPSELFQAAKERGLITLREAGILKVARGRTTVAEVMRAVF